MNQLHRLKNIVQSWQDAIITYVPNLVLGILVLVFFYFLASWFKKISYRIYTRNNKKQSQFAAIISTVIYIALLVSGVFLALEAMGLDDFLTKLLAGAGIVGIVAGFAFKDIVSNFFSGLLIKSQNPLRLNDWIQVRDAFGRVDHVGWITTTLRNPFGQLLYIPNQIVYSNVVTNYSRFQKRMVAFSGGVSYGDDLEHVKKVALDEVKHIDALLPNEPIDLFFTEIGGYSYNFELRFWIVFSDQKQYMQAMSDCIMRIKKRFEQENISMAYPVTTLDFGVKGGVNIFDKPLVVKQEEANPSV